MFESDKIDYKSAGKAPTLEVPPDLTQLSRENRYAVPGGAVTANELPGRPGRCAEHPDAPSRRWATCAWSAPATQRWLVVNRPAEQLWEPVRDFWQENGFLLTTDQRNLGIMETDWAENRAKLPQDIIRSTLGKLIDSVYSTGELDRFRTRLERTPSRHRDLRQPPRHGRGLQQHATKDQTVWQPRASDPELETEFLRRLMIKLGVSQEQSKAADRQRRRRRAR